MEQETKDTTGIYNADGVLLDGKFACSEDNHNTIKNVTTFRIGQDVLDTFKSWVRDGEISNDSATELWNDLAKRMGWETVTSLLLYYTVEVTYSGDVLATFSGIEASDDEEAIDTVRDNLDISELEVSGTLSYKRDDCDFSITMGSYEIDLVDSLEFEATIE